MRRLLTLGLLAFALGGASGPLELETLEGESVALALRDGERALVVHFWATWCPECLDELPLLARSVERCAAGAVRIVTVDVGESRDTLARYLERHGLALPVLRDPRGRVWRALSGVGLPANLTWTPEGRRVETGPRAAAAWDQLLEGLGCPAAAEEASPPGGSAAAG
jgi:thiol-disulfide isomerase/thioredoxin